MEIERMNEKSNSKKDNIWEQKHFQVVGHLSGADFGSALWKLECDSNCSSHNENK